MTKQRGPADFSSSNCQVPVCCQMCSLSHPLEVYFAVISESFDSWRTRLVWLDVGQEGTRSEETPAALQQQSHPQLVRSGVEGPAEHPR